MEHSKRPHLTSIYRSHTCRDISNHLNGNNVVLSGWVMRKRDHGGVVFVDLRDHYGIIQLVFSGELATRIEGVRVESVIQVHGQVTLRGADRINPSILNGDVEVVASELKVLTTSKVLPFLISEDDQAPESTRLEYRFLELRRQELAQTIVLRSEVMHVTREIMRSMGFREYQTPILTSSSPEGARDFLVPSRRHPGKFFALPQAPQIFKQLLMVAGFDRYFQIAPCFRDEDPRADRSPGEFYQCDLEMSFVDQDDVLKVGEELFSRLFGQFTTLPVTPSPFPRITYFDAIERFGTDKPDLRISPEIHNVTSIFGETQFKVFQNELSSGGIICALPIPVAEFPARKFLDDSVEFFTRLAGKGIGYLLIDKDSFKGSIAKFVSDVEVEGLRRNLQISSPTVVYVAAGQNRAIQVPVGKLRLHLAQEMHLIKADQFKFLWIVDMPFYEFDEESKKLEFGHNPFSMPKGGLEALRTLDPLEIRANQYDLVCNGYELVSGAIRNHEPEILYEAFEKVGYSKEVVNERFGALAKAFQYGTPPHGGMAAGMDRIVMLLSGRTAIRDVIPFPLAQSTEDLMMGAPSEATEKQLRELYIKSTVGRKEG
jgi:aspartyl-tRNA synthetase